VNATSTRRVVVEPGGSGVVAHVGLHALGAFADRLGLGDSLSACIVPKGERLPLHDRGKVLVHTALMLAGGGESCADIEHLRLQEDLFGSVPSDTTVFRAFHEVNPATRARLALAMAKVRAKVWSDASLTSSSEPVILDIDASLVEIHSEHKEDAAPTFKGGYGFHPMFCFADATGEVFAAVLRPGNAGANTVADHVSVLESAVEQLPAQIAAVELENRNQLLAYDTEEAAAARAAVMRSSSELGTGCAGSLRSTICRASASPNSASSIFIGFSAGAARCSTERVRLSPSRRR